MSDNSELPRLMLIADGFASGRGWQTAYAIQRWTVALVNEGLSFVQLRDHSVTAIKFEKIVRRLVEEMRAVRADVVITLNSRMDLAESLNCGVHVGEHSDYALRAAFQSGKVIESSVQPIGYSAHTLEDVRYVATHAFTFATFSPIFSTASHPNVDALGLEALANACKAVPQLPVFALGGINGKLAKKCVDAGAHGVAVVSDLLAASDPEGALLAYRNMGLL